MGKDSSFVEAIRAASGELRREPFSPVRLNEVAARIDQLGRRLHGLGWARDYEIGGCLTAAVGELTRARGLPEVERAGPVHQALRHLETALTYTDAGVRPKQPEPVTEPGAGAKAPDERD